MLYKQWHGFTHSQDQNVILCWGNEGTSASWKSNAASCRVPNRCWQILSMESKCNIYIYVKDMIIHWGLSWQTYAWKSNVSRLLLSEVQNINSCLYKLIDACVIVMNTATFIHVVPALFHYVSQTVFIENFQNIICKWQQKCFWRANSPSNY